MNWKEKGSSLGFLRLRNGKEPAWDEGFVGLAMALALLPEGGRTGDVERWAAVVPQGHGRMRKVDTHKRELEEMEAEDEKASLKGTKKEASPRTPSTPFLRSSPRFPIPVHYLSRQQRNIPGLIRIKRDDGSPVNFAQSFRYSTPSATSRPSKSPRPQLKPAPLSPLRSSIETSVLPHTGIKSYDGDYKCGLRHGQGTAEYWNGEKYEGRWVQGAREGEGTWWGKEGKGQYVGEWKRDKKQGAGVVTFENGDTLEAKWSNGIITPDPVVLKLPSQSILYKGSFLDLQPSGQGTMQYIAEAVTYAGAWKQGNRHGHGVVTFQDGSFFEGVFESDYTTGAGLLVIRKAIELKTDYKTPTTSERSKKSSKRQIQTAGSDKTAVNPTERTSALGDLSRYQYFYKETEQFPHDILFKSLSLLELSSSGHSYAVSPGCFCAGKLTGAGVGLYGGAAVYHGSFKEGRKAGYGCMDYSNFGYTCVGLAEAEGKYLGEWRADLRHGKGRMEWTSGAVYEGQFREDQRHFVTGTMQFPNGDRYEGAWVHNLMHGHGTYTTADNYQFKGLFLHGHISAEGTLLCPNGVRYEGEVRDLKPTGEGRMHYPNGNVYEGEVVRGVRMGEGRLEYENGDWYRGEWREDWRDGVGVMYYGDKKETYEGSWRRNKRSGQGKLLNCKKEVLYEGMWRDDVMEGKGVLTDHFTSP